VATLGGEIDFARTIEITLPSRRLEH